MSLENWEEEFDRRFEVLNRTGYEFSGGPIKFIRSLPAEARREGYEEGYKKGKEKNENGAL